MKPSYRKSWAGNLLMSDLTLDNLQLKQVQNLYMLQLVQVNPYKFQLVQNLNLYITYIQASNGLDNGNNG